MKSTFLLDIVIGWTAIACVAVVFVASALDPPEDATAGRPVPAFPAGGSR